MKWFYALVPLPYPPLSPYFMLVWYRNISMGCSVFFFFLTFLSFFVRRHNNRHCCFFVCPSVCWTDQSFKPFELFMYSTPELGQYIHILFVVAVGVNFFHLINNKKRKRLFYSRILVWKRIRGSNGNTISFKQLRHQYGPTAFNYEYWHSMAVENKTEK